METITISVAGGSRGNPGPAAIGVLVCDAAGNMIQEMAEAIGNATNSFAQYYAVMRALQLVKEQYAETTPEIQFELRLDSELVKRQLNGESEIKDPGLVPYFIEIHNMRVSSFPNLDFIEVSKKDNKEAVLLVHEALEG